MRELIGTERITDQDYLIIAQESTKDAAWLERARASNERHASIDGVLKTMSEQELDFIVSLTDGPISGIAAIAGMLTSPRGLVAYTNAGCPTANIPLGYLEPSGRPFGMTIIAKSGEEAKLLEVMAIYERTFPKRRLPSILLGTDSIL